MAVRHCGGLNEADGSCQYSDPTRTSAGAHCGAKEEVAELPQDDAAAAIVEKLTAVQQELVAHRALISAAVGLAYEAAIASVAGAFYRAESSSNAEDAERSRRSMDLARDSVNEALRTSSEATREIVEEALAALRRGALA